MDSKHSSVKTHRGPAQLAVPSAVGLALVVLLALVLLADSPRQTALAAPAADPTPPAATDVYTIYLPLLTKNFPPEVRPNDPDFDKEWGLGKVEATRAWGITCGCNTQLIAVLDSGTDLDHPDLADKVRTDIDWDYMNNDDVADDDYGHGTHVSGIAAAATNNYKGVAGLGWEAAILPVKVLDNRGYGDSGKLADAIRYAADQGATVINMSLGGGGSCPGYLQSAVDYAYDKGVVLVAAAGNHGTQPNESKFPANCNHVLGVAATEQDDSIAGYSNYGSHVSVAAPGSEIHSTLMGGGYGLKWGTSMATPHVAGLAALVLTRYPTYTPDEVASAILDNAVDLGAAGWDQYYGCGRIDAYQTLFNGAQASYPACLGTQAWSTAADRTTAPFVPGEVIVSFHYGAAQVEAVALWYGAAPEFLPGLDAWRLRVPPGREEALLARLRADPGVAYADLNYLVTAW